MSSSSNEVRVGRVVGLWRYPVKSMAAEPLAEVDVSWHGLAGDRRWAFVRDGVVESGFPWLTLRERNDMNRYRPSFVDPQRPDASAMRVHTPSGALLDVTDPALARELSPSGARVLRQDRGIFDTFPLSLVTTQSIARLGETVGTTLDVQRFRPNFLVEAEGERAVRRGFVGRLDASHRGDRRPPAAARQAGRSLPCHHARSGDGRTRPRDPPRRGPRPTGLLRRLRHDRQPGPRRDRRLGVRRALA